MRVGGMEAEEGVILHTVAGCRVLWVRSSSKTGGAVAWECGADMHTQIHRQHPAGKCGGKGHGKGKRWERGVQIEASSVMAPFTPELAPVPLLLNV